MDEKEILKIKEHLLTHLPRLPENQRELIKNKIISMNAEEMQNFLKENNIKYTDENNQNCIFCSIVDKKINSYKIGEDDNHIAILEINPKANGHTIIVPKKHKDENSDKSIEFAKKISEIIIEKLSPSNIEFLSRTVTGHNIIDIIPSYQDNNTKIENIALIHKKIVEKTNINIPQKKEEDIVPKIKLRTP